MSESKFDVSQVASEWGPFVNRGQNKNDIRKKLLAAPNSGIYMTKMPTNNDYIDLALADLSDVLQRFQSAWTPKGDLTFTPNRLYLDDLKVDFEYNVSLLRGTWLEFLAGNPELDSSKMPFVAWYIQEHLIPKIQKNLDDGLFLGKLATIVPGTPTSALGSLNGLKAQIVADLTATTPKMNRLTRTADVLADGSNALDVIEEFCEKIPEAYNTQPMYLYCSPNRRRQYMKSKRDQFGAAYKFEDVVDGFENIKFAPLKSMVGQDMMFITMKENLIYGVKDETNENVFKIESYKRQLSAYTQFKAGVGFAVNEAVFVSAKTSDLV